MPPSRADGPVLTSERRGDGETAPPRPRPAAAAAPRRRRRRNWSTIVLFLTPALLVFGLLVLTPMVVAAYSSFFNWNGFGLPGDFVGLDNFRRLLVNEVFVGDLRRTL